MSVRKRNKCKVKDMNNHRSLEQDSIKTDIEVLRINLIRATKQNKKGEEEWRRRNKTEGVRILIIVIVLAYLIGACVILLCKYRTPIVPDVGLFFRGLTQ